MSELKEFVDLVDRCKSETVEVPREIAKAVVVSIRKKWNQAANARATRKPVTDMSPKAVANRRRVRAHRASKI